MWKKLIRRLRHWLCLNLKHMYKFTAMPFSSLFYILFGKYKYRAAHLRPSHHSDSTRMASASFKASQNRLPTTETTKPPMSPPDRPCRRRLDVRIRRLIHRRRPLRLTTTTMAATLPERPFRMRRRND